MEKLLIFIKHHLRFLWNIIENFNSALFVLLYSKSLLTSYRKSIERFSVPPFSYRRLDPVDSEQLFSLINSQDPADLKYFSPHGFDRDSVTRQFRNRSFLMMGAFDGEKLIGYFFLRFFSNRKCFVGRLIGRDYRGKGIGPVMNDIMYETAWAMKFRCLSTISRNNHAVMGAHAKNRAMIILKELQNDYLLVEFIKPGSRNE